jgi:hypothetical protein
MPCKIFTRDVLRFVGGHVITELGDLNDLTLRNLTETGGDMPGDTKTHLAR